MQIIIERKRGIFIRSIHGIFSSVTPLSEVVKQLPITMSRSDFTGLPESSIGQILGAQVPLVLIDPAIIALRYLRDNPFIPDNNIVLNILWNLLSQVLHLSYPSSHILTHQRAFIHGALPIPGRGLPEEVLDFIFHADIVFGYRVIFYSVVFRLF